MRESKIEAYLVERVKALDGEVRKVVWQGRHGAPDRLVMLPARESEHSRPIFYPALTAFVELKATGVAPEAHQLREHTRLRAMGQKVVVIDSLDGVDNLVGPAPW